MSHPWPAETAFRRIDLYVRDQKCAFCETALHVRAPQTVRIYLARSVPLEGAVGPLSAPGLPGPPWHGQPVGRNGPRPAAAHGRVGCVRLDRSSTLRAALVGPTNLCRTGGQPRDRSL